MVTCLVLGAILLPVLADVYDRSTYPWLCLICGLLFVFGPWLEEKARG